MTETDTLLGAFFRDGRGYVLYKAYQPHRGDDVQALLELSSALPPGVRFLPISPATEVLQDIRQLLADLLVDPEMGLEIHVEEERPDPLPRDWERDAQARLIPVLRQVLGWLQAKKSPEAVLEDLEKHHRGLYRAALRVVAASTAYFPPEPGVTQRDQLRRVRRIPIDEPTLVIGRPELYQGYETWSADEVPTDFRSLLDRLGYPNRFYFWQHRSRQGIRDRKTVTSYEIRGRERHQRDLGFILAGRTASGQPVMVASGTSSLGTYAAVRILLQRRGPEEAIRAVEHPEQGPVDIGLQCRLECLAERRPFPLSQDPSHLHIDLLNPGDTVGYRWNRRAYERFAPLFRPGENGGGKIPDPPMTWSWEPRRGAEDRGRDRGRDQGGSGHFFTRVTITTTPYRVSKERQIYPSGPLARVLEAVLKDLEVDRDHWRRRLEKLPAERLKALLGDQDFQTFRPILILGRTGTGKQWIAEFIARGWNGSTIDDPGREPGDTPAAIFDRAMVRLEARLENWLGTAPPAGPGLLTFATVATPGTLLDSQLFGVAPGAFTHAEPGIGVFLKAGTGVLFLDELLELEPSLQARLLVVLQTGRVQPLGLSGAEYCYICRLVAATNRAETEEHLQELAARREVRRDVAARLSRRYALPALAERPLEIVPLAISLIRRHWLAGEPEDSQCYLRTSRQALEVLLTHAYPENIRDLEAFVLDLPEELVRSFRISLRDDADGDLRERAILLRHLRRLGVRSPHREGAPRCGEVWIEEGQEVDFYEFALQPAAEGVDPRPEPALNAAESEWRGRIVQAVRPVDPSRRPGSLEVLLQGLREGGALREPVSEILRATDHLHSQLKKGAEAPGRDEGLDVKRARRILKVLGDDTRRRLPLGDLNLDRDAAERLMEALGPLRKRVAGGGGGPGRPAMAHRDVVLMLLSGKDQRLYG